jgi:hypothetical protein
MFKSPVRKLAKFFQRSRDGWKRKCQSSKTECRRWANQARAVTKSRDEWRRKAEASAREVAALKSEIAALQKWPGG